MSEPRTAAGRAAMEFLQTRAWLENILAIEAEARAAALDAVERAVIELPCPGPCDGFEHRRALHDALAAIDALRERSR